VEPYRSSFDESRSYAHNGDEENASSVIVVLIYGPKQETGDLKDIKRMKCLKLCKSPHYAKNKEDTNFVHKKLRDRLLFDVYHVLAKDPLTLLLLVSIDTNSDRFDISPCWVLPAIAKDEFVL
jgi:hypothetical protein